MSNELISSENESQDKTVYDTRIIQVMGNGIRTVEIGKKLLFSITDLYKCLGLTNPGHASKIIGEPGIHRMYIRSIDVNGVVQRRLNNFCDEADVYTLIGRCDKPEAKKMTRAIHEVVAEYRQKGYVAAPEYKEQINHSGSSLVDKIKSS